jgi:pimeloyl-ACP methyl ester carboxylesterase
LWLEAFNESSWSGAARVAAFADIANQLPSTDGPALALKPLLTVAVGCWWGNPTQETRDLVVAAAERLHAAEDDPALIAILACADPVKRGAHVIGRIARMTPDPTGDPAALHLVGWAATAAWAFDLSWGFLSAAVEGLREQGRLGLLAQALVSQSWAAIHLAKETPARSAADEAARLARETGQLRWTLAADLAKATIAGERGDFETATALANQAEALLLPIGAQAMLSLVQFARGRYAHQRYSDAYVMAHHLPDARVGVYPDAGHGFLFQWPVEFAEMVTSFLSEGDERKPA